MDRHIEARVDREHWTITRGGRETMVRPFPISIDFASQAQQAASIGKARAAAVWRDKLGIAPDVVIGGGIERMDFTKGIADRFRALDSFFERHPDWRGRMSFVQIAAPSRSHLPAHQAAEREVAELARSINERWGTTEWKPLHLLETHHGMLEMTPLHLAADYFIVNSLHDGMNLVAKEYCASRVNDDDRKVPDQWQAPVISQIDTVLQDFPEFRTQPGHKVMEIVPALPINKATAVQRLLSRLRLPQRACFFAGDDIADENVFRALPNAVTVSVSQKITAARWIADSPADLAGLLAALKK